MGMTGELGTVNSSPGALAPGTIALEADAGDFDFMLETGTVDVGTPTRLLEEMG